MGEPSTEIPAVEKPSEKRLDSWKEIAVYLTRDVTTVQRWEKREGMPVHRHVHDKRGSVYALTEELDAWIQSRSPRVDEAEKKPETEVSPSSRATAGRGWCPILASGWPLQRLFASASGWHGSQSGIALQVR